MCLQWRLSTGSFGDPNGIWVNHVFFWSDQGGPHDMQMIRILCIFGDSGDLLSPCSECADMCWPSQKNSAISISMDDPLRFAALEVCGEPCLSSKKRGLNTWIPMFIMPRPRSLYLRSTCFIQIWCLYNEWLNHVESILFMIKLIKSRCSHVNSHVFFARKSPQIPRIPRCVWK